MEQSAINQRLNLVVDTFESGIKAAFARKVDMSPQGVQEILAGRKGAPSFKVLVKILESYPQVCSDWLVLGQGPMLRGATDAEKGNSNQIGGLSLESSRNNLIVPIFTADKLHEKDGKDTYARIDEVISLPASMLKAGLHRAFSIQDSTMEPTFSKGDLIIATQMQDSNWSRLPKGNLVPQESDSFPMCVIEVQSEKGKSIEFGRCCVDLKRKVLYCLKDNQVHNLKSINLIDIKTIWEFDIFLSSRSLNPAKAYIKAFIDIMQNENLDNKNK